MPQKETKTNIIKNVIKVPQPDAIIDLDTKIYLAVAPDTATKEAIIHTLACLKQDNSNYYNLIAVHEINLFKDPQVAKLFLNAVTRVIEQNRANEKWKWMFDWNTEEIKEFIQNVR